MVPLLLRPLPSDSRTGQLHLLLLETLESVRQLNLQDPNANEATVRMTMDQFFIEAVKLYLPDAVEMKEAFYRSALALSVDISGIADQLFVLQNTTFPLIDVEHKAFTVNLRSQYLPEVAQTFSQVMGWCEKIAKAYRILPEQFVGILTNGKEWISVRRRLECGEYSHEHSPPVSAFELDSSGQLIVSQMGVDAILVMLMDCFTVASSLADALRRKISQSISIDQDNESHSSTNHQSEDPESRSRKRQNKGGSKSRSLPKKQRSGTETANSSKQRSASTTKNTSNRDLGTRSSAAILSDRNLNIFLRDPQNTHEDLTLQRFLFAKEIF
jgi:hypothetical protein